MEPNFAAGQPVFTSYHEMYKDFDREQHMIIISIIIIVNVLQLGDYEYCPLLRGGDASDSERVELEQGELSTGHQPDIWGLTKGMLQRLEIYY